MKIGLYFGSFNPIHIGHIIVANYTLEHTDIDEIWLIISPQNPFKKNKKLLDKNYRLMLTKNAINKYHNIKTSNIEFELPIPSYSYKTLKIITHSYQNNDFAIVMGYKNFLSLNKWKNYKKIIKKFQIYTYPEDTKNNYIIQHYNNNNKILTKAPVFNISSSLIRKLIKKNKNIDFLIPYEIIKYKNFINKFYKN